MNCRARRAPAAIESRSCRWRSFMPASEQFHAAAQRFVLAVGIRRRRAGQVTRAPRRTVASHPPWCSARESRRAMRRPTAAPAPRAHRACRPARRARAACAARAASWNCMANKARCASAATRTPCAATAGSSCAHISAPSFANAATEPARRSTCEFEFCSATSSCAAASSSNGGNGMGSVKVVASRIAE